MRFLFFFLLFLTYSFVGFAQTNKTIEKKPTLETIEDTTQTLSRIELLQAGVLEGDVLPNGEQIRILKKDERGQVKFKQKNTVMYADSVFQYIDRNQIEAFGNIRFVEKDSMTLVGDTLYYDGYSKLARVRGNVVLQDQEKTVTTQKLNYNLKTKTAYYFEGGRVRDQTSRLTSDRGYYNTDSRVATFRGNVQAISPDQQLFADSVVYNTLTKTIFFDSEGKIINKDGTINAVKGTQINAQTGILKTAEGADVATRVENRDYIISANFIDYDNLTEKGVFKENVQLYYKKEQITIFGDEAYYDGIKSRLDAYGDALLVKPFKNDTLYISADTLIAMNDSVAAEQRFYGYRNVKIYKRDIQGICDSINYDLTDSIIYFNYDPVLWNTSNQLSGTKIRAKLQDNSIDSLIINDKAFVISSDVFGQFNQIKGRDLLAVFDSGYIKNVNVDGNGESIYFVLEEKKNEETLLKGMNYIKCSNIIMKFIADNELEEILFLQQPEGQVIPPQLITKTNSRLGNFEWRIDEKPTYNKVMQGRSIDQAANNTYKVKNVDGKRIIDGEFFGVYLSDDQTKLTYYHPKLPKRNLDNEFFLYVYPQNKKDLPEEFKLYGYVVIPFYNMNTEVYQPNQPFYYTQELPKFKIKKITTGQKKKIEIDEETGEVIPNRNPVKSWKETYEF
ncbi:OstA-like protein [Bernardetia sp.]|uniref:OstA-like protein n=1 Tax=Bernardetia sp. TaxID=1937974 RepID=UPI0025C69BE6|nr:OstA-like protein [Bernardetia sp.]